jgi:ABC-2 type transport system ATP-binding protein
MRTAGSASSDAVTWVYLARIKGASAQTARTEAMEYLDRFGFADHAREQVQKLSLGNQQRIQVTASLLADPAVLILDEPFSGPSSRAASATSQDRHGPPPDNAGDRPRAIHRPSRPRPPDRADPNQIDCLLDVIVTESMNRGGLVELTHIRPSLGEPRR